MKCPACGLVQMARPTCKSCGSPLGGPAPGPSLPQLPERQLERFRGAQIENQNPEEKPPAVKAAVKLFWAVFALGQVKGILDFAHYSAMVPAAFIIYGWVPSTALWVFLIAKISAGRNWARIFWLIGFALGMPLNFALGIISAEFTRAPVIGALSLLQWGMHGYGLFLLFTQRGSVWFRKYKFA